MRQERVIACLAADFVEINWGLSTEWDAVSSVPGTWTETLNGFQGGTASAPVYLIGGSPVAGLSGTISGLGAEDFYWFIGQEERSAFPHRSPAPLAARPTLFRRA